jgi:hypothetical protein
MLSVVMLNYLDDMLSDTTLNVVMLNVIVLSVVVSNLLDRSMLLFKIKHAYYSHREIIKLYQSCFHKAFSS